MRKPGPRLDPTRPGGRATASGRPGGREVNSPSLPRKSRGMTVKNGANDPSRTSVFGHKLAHTLQAAALSDSKAAKPIVAFIFPVAAGVIIEHDKPDHVL